MKDKNDDFIGMWHEKKVLKTCDKEICLADGQTSNNIKMNKIYISNLTLL